VTTPVVFVSHGAPTAALEDDPYTRALAELGSTLARPQAVVVVSAHWQARETTPRTTGADRPETIHDFGGFPDELHRMVYPCRGAPELAARIAQTLGGAVDPGRGLDHGVWVPLHLMFPYADVPVVELALPRSAGASDFLAAGRALAPLRDEGVLLVGSGGMVHNLGQIDFGVAGHGNVSPWARGFDRWATDRLRHGDLPALLDFERQGPDAGTAHPTPEHFLPLFFTLGAGKGAPFWIHEGFRYGSLSLRSFMLLA
jgi:4,5-DOPA dioxygenase extradiol